MYPEGHSIFSKVRTRRCRVILGAVGITVGLIAAIQFYASGPLGISGFAGFFGWGSHYAASGRKTGSVKALCGNLSVVFWGLAVVRLSEILRGSFQPVIVALAVAFHFRFAFFSSSAMAARRFAAYPARDVPG